ncbi:hypothetical protein [Salinibacter ruber]|uniref:Uncharacterized protein n=1 Tax=Salinibacter ruber TaxID=146919 RepID=A0A9X2ULW1_9BACT|nr:hypothetical protein [Salinibacter ruber]MCS3614560.1 hypothetical protein [Salinibacter ruber]MCS3673242.1 hypothetical protein [Salinibacter ruber]MCS4036992.1 hypothetical protein [Salinibacter ruber]
MDRSEAEELASDDIILRYGLAELISSGYQEDEPVEEAAEKRIRELKSAIRAYVEPRNYSENASGTASVVTDPSSETGLEVVGNGYHVRSHVLNTDLNGQHTVLTALKNGKPKDSGKLLQRYYPHASKLSIGNKNAANVKAAEAARKLAFITTLTPQKPSRIVDPEEDARGALLPSLPLEDLVQFIDVFREAPGPGLRWHMRGGKPRLNERDGNFASSPPTWAFSTVGLLAAVSDWSEEAEYDLQARELIGKLSRSRLFLVGESDITPRSFDEAPHLETLASEAGKLVRNAWRAADQLTGEDPFYFRLHRFLTQFDWHSLRQFLSVRVTYPPQFEPFLTGFFLQDMDPDVIAAAKAAGKHANSCCYRAAKENDSYKSKETYLDELEGIITSADSGPELLARLSTQVGRLPKGDFPESAEPFFDALNAGEIDLKRAKNVLRSYLRIGTTFDNSSNDNGNNDNRNDDSSSGDGGNGSPSDISEDDAQFTYQD